MTRTHWRLRTMAAVGAVLLCAVAGCSAVGGTGSQARPSAATASQSGSGLVATRLASAYSATGDTRVRFAPPPPADRARASADQAFGTCATGESVCGQSAPDSITLALVTDFSSGTLDASGGVAPAVANRLSYVMTWNDLPRAPAGPAPGTSAFPASCLLVAVVDADTGSNLFGYRLGTPSK